MTDEQALALLKEALHEVSPAKARELEQLDLNTRVRDAGIDSVAAMEMVGAIEERLQVTFPDEDLAQLNRFIDIVDLIKSARA